MVAPGREGMPAPRPLPFPEAESVGEIGRTCIQSYGVFPNWVSPLNQYIIPPLLFWPNGVDRCRYEVWTMIQDWGDAPRPPILNMWTNADGSELTQVLQEDTQFSAAIQRSLASRGFVGVPLSYQEARIYHWHQAADQMIGAEKIPEALRVAPVIGDDWIHPNDPRLAELGD